MKLTKVGVYGTLKRSGYNSFLLEDSKFLGSFLSEPNYTLYDLGAFPAVVAEGDTAIFFEVYEVDEQTLQQLNRLEGFLGEGNPFNFYDRMEINSPFGAVSIYYMKNAPMGRVVESGNWGD